MFRVLNYLVSVTPDGGHARPPQRACRRQRYQLTASDESLIEFDARGKLTVLGLPVLTHPGVDAATFFWGILMDRVVRVLRKDAEVSRSKDSGFYNDALDVRAITRVGVGFLHEAAAARGYDAAWPEIS